MEGPWSSGYDRAFRDDSKTKSGGKRRLDVAKVAGSSPAGPTVLSFSEQETEMRNFLNISENPFKILSGVKHFYF